MNEYYKTCPFPKPQDKKKTKLQNGYKNKPERRCIYCGEPNAERHEVFPGTANRQISIDNGFQIDVCNPHHRLLQENIASWAVEENKRLKAEFERKYLDKLIAGGMSEKDALKVWMSMMGRNYIEELMPE